MSNRPSVESKRKKTNDEKMLVTCELTRLEGDSISRFIFPFGDQHRRKYRRQPSDSERAFNLNGTNCSDSVLGR